MLTRTNGFMVLYALAALGLIATLVNYAPHGSNVAGGATPPVAAAYVTDECPGGPTATPAKSNWNTINPGRKCRVVARVKVGLAKFRGSDGETPPIGPGGGHMMDMEYDDMISLAEGTVVNIGLCPKWTANIQFVGWDCKPLTSTAGS